MHIEKFDTIHSLNIL